MTVSKLPQPDKPYPGKGKVLRVKEGFNPNSSSLGSVVFSMSAALIAVPVVLNAAASWIASRAAEKTESPGDAQTEKKEVEE